jgi:hypothetical protein
LGHLQRKALQTLNLCTHLRGWIEQQIGHAVADRALKLARPAVKAALTALSLVVSGGVELQVARRFAGWISQQ